MARKTIRQRILSLQKKFPYRTKYAFIYSRKTDLKKRFTEINVYALIYDEERGHSLFNWQPHRAHQWTPQEWNDWLNKKGLSILAHDVMEAINAKRGSNWQMQRLVAFSGDTRVPVITPAGEKKNAVHKRKGKRQRKTGNKTHAKRK